MPSPKAMATRPANVARYGQQNRQQERNEKALLIDIDWNLGDDLERKQGQEE
jgi:hypothetical protein